ncbi:response regulator [Ancylobacter sp.]|uniref:response regulator n=1 Tax=Ancylobacter sp. TaxID=1872567 RepID=UPI003D11854F
MDDQPPLSGQRVFIVEDETLVAMMIEGMLEELGATVVGNESRSDDALNFVASRHGEIDVAMLDLNLGTGHSYAIAEAIAGHGIPIVFSTGYTDSAIDAAWRSCPVLNKPFQLADLQGALSRALDRPAA